MLKLNTLSALLFLSSPALAGAIETPVVGGTPVPAGKWPDVALVVAHDALCTGTLIAPDVVLTAGHCIGIDPVEVVLDTVDFGEPGGEAIKVKSATAYPDWQHSFDVGVLVLDHAAREKPRAIAAACTAKEHVAVGDPVHIVGFGLTAASGKGMNTQLHEADLAITDATCAQDPACQPSIAPGGEIVAGGGGTDSCFGDSGGPLYVTAAGSPALIAVVSRGLAETGTPCGHGGVYVRADRVVSWIEKVTGRTIARAKCDRPADDDGTADASASGGCSTTSGAIGGGLVACVIAALWILTAPRRSRRRA